VLFGCASDAASRKLGLDFRVIGYTDIDDRLRKLNVVVTGPYYSKQELYGQIEAYAPDVAFFPSIWPETYLYTLSDAFNRGIFPVAFNIGAPAERIVEAEWGALIDFDDRYNFGFINDSLLEVEVGAQKGSPITRQRTGNPAHYYGYLSDLKSQGGSSLDVKASNL
jgi:hypothetical protein